MRLLAGSTASYFVVSDKIDAPNRVFTEILKSGELIRCGKVRGTKSRFAFAWTPHMQIYICKKYYYIFAKVIKRVRWARIAQTSAVNKRQRRSERSFVDFDAIGIDEKQQNLFSLWLRLLPSTGFLIQHVLCAIVYDARCRYRIHLPCHTKPPTTCRNICISASMRQRRTYMRWIFKLFARFPFQYIHLLRFFFFFVFPNIFFSHSISVCSHRMSLLFCSFYHLWT